MRKFIATMLIASTMFGATYSPNVSAMPGATFCNGGNLWVVSYRWNA